MKDRDPRTRKREATPVVSPSTFELVVQISLQKMGRRSFKMAKSSLLDFYMKGIKWLQTYLFDKGSYIYVMQNINEASVQNNMRTFWLFWNVRG